MAKGQKFTQALCTDSWKTFPAFGYAQHQNLVIKDVAWENGSWINTWVVKNALVLKVSFTDYILALYVLCWPYAQSSLFLAPIKRLDYRNKVVSPCRDCPSVVLLGSPFPSPGEENSHSDYFGQRDFVKVNKVKDRKIRSSWTIQVGPKSSDNFSFKKHTGEKALWGLLDGVWGWRYTVTSEGTLGVT